jgi:hypothetical protein
MNSKLAASLVAILAVTMTGAGGLAASASAAEGRPAGTTQAKAEQLSFMSTAATSTQISVIATGAFTAGGTDTPGKATDVLTFPGGTLQFRPTQVTFSASFDPQTCLLTESQTGKYTLGHGTGSYADVKGSGKYSLGIVGVTKKNHSGQCIDAQAPATFQQITTAKGTVTG